MPGYLIFMLILAIIGLINTSYLSYHTIKHTLVKCLFFPPEWCRAVQESKYSRTLGIPNSFAGFVIYALILVMVLMYSAGSISFAPLMVVISFGFAFSMYFTFIQAFVIRAFCTWCVLSAIEFTLLFITALTVK